MDILYDIFMTVVGYLKADWIILLIGIIIAVSINVYVDSEKLKSALERNSRLSIPGSVAFGAFTPLCACGTMAVLLSMFISAMPWGPVMAFLISSPLTSPSEYMFQTSFLGNRFANAVLIASIFLGIFSGYLAHILSKKTTFFEGQFKLLDSKSQSTKACCETKIVSIDDEICCASSKVEQASLIEKLKIKELLKAFVDLGLKKVLLYFVVFIAIGRVAEMIIPQEWILSLFSGDKGYSIPLGATIGLPLYVSSSAALPLMKSFLNSGAGEGVLLAFLITGKATGVPVIAGMSTILKKKAIFFYVGIVYIGGILSGLIYQLLLELYM